MKKNVYSYFIVYQLRDSEGNVRTGRTNIFLENKIKYMLNIYEIENYLYKYLNAQRIFDEIKIKEVRVIDYKLMDKKRCYCPTDLNI